MFKYSEFKTQKHFKGKCWYICRLVLQCFALAIIPAAFNSLIFFVATPIANLLGFTQPWRNLDIEFDRYIPLIKVFIIPYLLIIVWWYIAPILIFLVNGQRQFYRYIIAQLTCAVAGLLFLIFLPTNCDQLRPISSKYSSNSIVDKMLRAVYSDNSNGAFPSFHVINTWTIFIIAREKSEDNRRHWIFVSICGILAITTCLATLFVKQHWIVDVLAGIVIAELVFVAYRLHVKQYALQTFMTWLNRQVKLEPISQHNGVYSYQLASQNQWKKYFALWLTLVLIAVFLTIFFSIVYFYKVTI